MSTGSGAVPTGSAEADGDAGGAVEQRGGAGGRERAGVGVGGQSGVNAGEDEVADLQAGVFGAGLQARDPGGRTLTECAGGWGPGQTDVGPLKRQFTGVDATGDERAERNPEADGMNAHGNAVAVIIDVEIGGGQDRLRQESEGDVAVDLDGATDPGGDEAGDAAAVAVPIEHARQDPDGGHEDEQEGGGRDESDAAGARPAGVDRRRADWDGGRHA